MPARGRAVSAPGALCLHAAVDAATRAGDSSGDDPDDAGLDLSHSATRIAVGTRGPTPASEPPSGGAACAAVPGVPPARRRVGYLKTTAILLKSRQLFSNVHLLTQY